MNLIINRASSQPGVKKPGEASNLIAELTLSNVERENMRLKQYITSLEKELDEMRNNKSTKYVENKGGYLTSEESSSANLKKALNMLIQHFEGLVAINENGDLIDLTKKVNNVIVKKELIKY